MSLSKFITKGSQFLLFDNSSRIVFVCESLFVGVTNLEYAKENLKNDGVCVRERPSNVDGLRLWVCANRLVLVAAHAFGVGMATAEDSAHRNCTDAIGGVTLAQPA